MFGRKDREAEEQTGQEKSVKNLRSIMINGGSIFLLLALCWSVLVLILAGISRYQHYNSALANAESAASHSLDKDLTVNRWANEHGRVYVPVTDRTPSSSCLDHLPEREVMAASNSQLTLLAPAYIHRQLHEMYEAELGVLGNLTSLQPLRAENTPDAWEEKTLHYLAENPAVSQVASLEKVAEKPYFRMMRPLHMESGCFKCHGNSGREAGEIMGGISVSVPWWPYMEHLSSYRIVNILIFGGLWLFGLLTLELIRQRLRNHLLMRQEAEADLRQSEKKFRLLAESTEAIPWEFDLVADRWTYIAPQVAGVVGFPPEAWTDLQFWIDRVHPDDREGAVAYRRGCISRGEDHVLEYRFLKKDGSIAWLRDVVNVEMSGGEPVLLRGTIVDLTGHRLLEERLRQSEKMEAVGTLAAGVAHDFNNILTSLISFATLAKRRNPEDEVGQEYLQEILDSSKRAAELTRSLLAYSRKQQIELKPENLNLIVDKHRKMLRRVIREDIEIMIELTPEALPVLADHVQIEQVLMNLAGNAQDAMPDGGVLTIGTELILQNPEDLELEASGPWAVLYVSDTGSGMTDKVSERIFDPFFTTKDVGRGTGLGLSMVLGTIKQHGGAITLDSKPSQGSTFAIFLPLQSPDPEGGGEGLKPAEEHQQGQEATILLVEDDAQVRRVLRRIVESQGYKVHMAADGEEAVTVFHQYADEIALVVMDIVMPGKNGRQAYGEMSALKPGLPVILISGYAADFIDDADFALECLHFISKPIQPGILAAKIREILAAPRKAVAKSKNRS